MKDKNREGESFGFTYYKWRKEETWKLSDSSSSEMSNSDV